jgi:hypothetical protein
MVAAAAGEADPRSLAGADHTCLRFKKQAHFVDRRPVAFEAWQVHSVVDTRIDRFPHV